jgi:hypothetical protein
MLTVTPELAHRSLPDRPLQRPDLRGAGLELDRVLPTEILAARSDDDVTMTTAIDVIGMTPVGMNQGPMIDRTIPYIRGGTEAIMTMTETVATMAVFDTLTTTTGGKSAKRHIVVLPIET